MSSRKSLCHSSWLARLFSFTFILLCLAVWGTAAQTGLPEVDEILQDEHLRILLGETGRQRLSVAISALEESLDLPSGFRATRERDVTTLVVQSCDAERVIRLAQFYFILANAFLEDRREIEDAYLCGKHWGLKGLRLNPEFAAAEANGFVEALTWITDVEALYWTSLNWLRTVELNNLAAVGSGVLSKTRAMLERALSLDPTYYACGPSRALGSFWGGLPRKPLGTYRRNLDRALYYFAPLIGAESAVVGDTAAGCADYLENRLNYVQFYLIEQRDWASAHDELQTILASPIGDAYPLENALAQQKAESLLSDVERNL